MLKQVVVTVQKNGEQERRTQTEHLNKRMM